MGPLPPSRSDTLRVLAALLLALSAHPAPARGAEEDPDSTASPKYRLAPVIVTGERLPVPLSRVPLDVTLIDRPRLDGERPLFLSDALRDVPSIDVQRSGGAGKLTDLRLRGADPRHTLVLYDGIALNGPWLGTFDFADLMDLGIDRVEVLGGPAASLYGSGAVGGVIQLLRPAGRESAAGGAGRAAGADERRGGGSRAFAEFGGEAAFRQGVAWSGAAGPAQAGFALARLTSDGAGPRDGYRGLSANAHAQLSAGSGGRLRASLLTTSGTKELPFDFYFDAADPTLSPFGSFRQIRDSNNGETDRLVAGGATWTRRLSPAAEVEGELSGLRTRIRNDNAPDGGANSNLQHTRTRSARETAALRTRLTPAPRLDVLLGGDYRSDRVERDDRYEFGGFGDTTRVDEGVHARALYAQAHWEMRERVLLDLGFRLDDHSRYGAYGVPRAALGYLWREAGLKLRGGFGRAFTAPTLSDLFYPGYGSERLRPERSRTWEAGADGSWLGGTVEAKVTYHHTRFRDLIQSNSFFVPDNIGEARIEGAEAALQVAAGSRVRLRGAAAHLVATDENTGAPLAKRPAWRFGLRGEAVAHRDLLVTAGWRWVDSMRDPFVFLDPAGRVLRGDLPGYASLDLGAVASLRRWAPLEADVRLTNALDRRYSEVKGFPAPGRTLTAGVGYRR